MRPPPVGEGWGGVKYCRRRCCFWTVGQDPPYNRYIHLPRYPVCKNIAVGWVLTHHNGISGFNGGQAPPYTREHWGGDPPAPNRLEQKALDGHSWPALTTTNNSHNPNIDPQTNHAHHRPISPLRITPHGRRQKTQEPGNIRRRCRIGKTKRKRAGRKIAIRTTAGG